MAGPLARLYATLGLDAREFDSGLGKAQKSITGFGKGADLAMGLAAGAVAAGLIGTIDAAREWETAFAGVKKTVDTTGLSLDQQTQAFAELEEGLRDLAKTIPITTTELAGLAEAGGALGVARKDLVEFARVTAIIGTTTDVVAQDAATSLGKIGTVIGLTAEDYDNFGATLVDLGNKGASFESEILETANRIAGTSAVVGLAADEILGWSAAIANVGIMPEAAGGSFQKFAYGIQNAVLTGGAQLETLAKTAGLTVDAFKELYGEDVSGAFEAVLVGYSKLDDAAKLNTRTLLKWGGEIRIKDFIAKLTSNVGNLTGSLDNSDTAWQQNTAMMAEAERRFETLDSGMQLFWNRVNDVAITLGRTLMPVVRGTVEHVGNLVDIFGDALKTFPQITNVVTPLVTALSGLLALKFGARFLTSMIPGGDQFAAALSQSLGSPLKSVATRLGLTFGTTFGLAAAGAALAILVPMVIEMFDKINALSAKAKGIDEAIGLGAFSAGELNAELALTEKLIAENRKQFTLFPDTIFGSGLAILPDVTGLTILEKHRDVIKARLALINGEVVSAAADPQARQAWRDILLGPQMQLGADTARTSIERWLGGTVQAIGGFVTGLGTEGDAVGGAFDDIATEIKQGFGSVKAALQGGDRIIDPDTRLKNMRSRLREATANLRQAIRVGDPIAEDYWRGAVSKAGTVVDRFWDRIHGTTRRKARAAADDAIGQGRRMQREIGKLSLYDQGVKLMESWHAGIKAGDVGFFPGGVPSVQAPRMPSYAVAGGRGGGVTIHINGLYGGEAGLRQLSREIARAVRLQSRDR